MSDGVCCNNKPSADIFLKVFFSGLFVEVLINGRNFAFQHIIIIGWA